MSQRPIAVALHLCEQIIVDARTRNVTPVNCFHELTIDGSLVEKQAFCVFATLIDGHGSVRMAFELERLDTLETIVRREFTLPFGDPLRPMRCMLRLRNVKFPVEGVYQASLIADTDPIASGRFTVSTKENST